jgi:predicted Ser/Thr protein kinase
VSERPPAQWQSGDQIAGWRVVGELGRGAMGVVYEAMSAEGRRVAIKTLLKRAEPRVRERFQREGEAQARVDRHSNLVRIHTAGEHSGQPYLVTELVTGGDLSSRLREEDRLEPEEARRVVVALARGAAHAHGQGVLHRDIKPSNVLFDEEGTPKLADFGIARVVDEESLTRTGQTLGTAGYMAPEQVDNAKRVDERADVYALGALLFACVSGRPPIAAGSTISTIYHLLSKPAPLLRSVLPNAPQALEEICARALERDPALRFPDATSLADALDEADFDAVEPRSRGWWAVALAVAAIGLLLLGWAKAPSQEGSARPAEAPVEREPVPIPGFDFDPNAWQLPAGARVRYRVHWNERAFAGGNCETDSVLVLEVSESPGALNERRVAVTWAFDRVGMPDPNSSFGGNAPDRYIKVTRRLVAVVADLDLGQGTLRVHQDPSAIAGQVAQVVSRTKTDSSSVFSTEDLVRMWARGAFRTDRLPRLLELTFARRPLSDGSFEWSKGRGIARARPTDNALALFPLLRNYTGYEEGAITASSLQILGTREESEGLPTLMWIEQTVTLPDEKFTVDKVRVELLGAMGVSQARSPLR